MIEELFNSDWHLYLLDSVNQAQLLLRDLKIAQCEFVTERAFPMPKLTSTTDTKLAPRAAFTAQIIGTLFGCVLNFSESTERFFHIMLTTILQS